jgi:hypothetical protein
VNINNEILKDNLYKSTKFVIECLECIRDVKIISMRLIFVSDNKNNVLLLGSDHLE